MLNASVEHQIHALLAGRRGSYAFDPEREVSEADRAALFEAARWNMSP